MIHFITTGEVKLGNRVISLDEFLTASHVKSRLLDAQIRFQQNPPPMTHRMISQPRDRHLNRGVVPSRY